MKLKRFFGLTSRAVLEQVRNELGPDAMIIANRSTAEGVEVDALAGDAVAALAAMDAGTGAPPPAAPAQRAPAAPPPGPLLTRAETADATRSAQATAMPATDAALSQVREDVAGLRTLLETQLSQLAWTDTLRRNPQRARLMRRAPHRRLQPRARPRAHAIGRRPRQPG